jgi:hypothetical protein
VESILYLNVKHRGVAELRKRLASIVPLTLFFLFILLSSTIFLQVSARLTVACPKLTNDVTIDGKWTSAQEWTDASEFPLTFMQGTGEAYFSMKHDNNNFYVLVDFVSRAQTVVGDDALVVLDTQNDGGKQINNDDLAILIRWNTVTESMGAVQWGGWTEQNWQPLPSGFEAKSSIEAQNDPHSTAPHEIFEFRIPETTFKASTSGLWVGIGGGGADYFALYPPADISSPDNWAQLEFSDQTLAELTATVTSVSTSSLSSTPPQTSMTQTATTSQGSGFSISSIPGFPVEAIFIGLVSGLVALTLTRRRK